MNKVLVILSILLFGFTSEQSQVDFELRLKEYYKSVSSLSADFKQQKKTILFNELLESNGKFYFTKPDLIRWEQSEPSPNYFALNGEKVIQFDGSNKTTSTKTNMQISMFKKFILKTIDGSILSDPAFSKKNEKDGPIRRIVLTPKQKQLKKRISNIVLEFNDNSLLLEKLAMIESEFEATEITFENQKVNEKLPLNLFN